MENHLSVYINATAKDIHDWLRMYFLDDGPLEKFYDSVVPKGGFSWTPLETMHDPEAEPNWWRYFLGVAENYYGVTLADAFDFCVTQSKSNPNDPRAHVTIGWDELFLGTAWEFLTTLECAYPETQPTIDSWKKTCEGQQAKSAEVTCKWWTERVSRPYYALLNHTDLADPNLTTDEFREKYLQTEEGKRLFAAAKAPWDDLPEEKQLWLIKMLDKAQYQYDLACYYVSETSQEQQKFWAKAAESYERVQAWERPEASESTETALPPFELWVQRYDVTQHKDGDVEVKVENENHVGRPSYPEDKWAWEEVLDHGRSQNEVFHEWLPKVKHRDLADPLETFKKMIKRAQKRRKEGGI